MQVRSSPCMQDVRLFKPYQMRGSPDRISACTTAYFDGMIAVIDPENSWVARWQRTCAYFIHLYALGLLMPLLQQNMFVECMPPALKVEYRRMLRPNWRVEELSIGHETRRTKIDLLHVFIHTNSMFIRFV